MNGLHLINPSTAQPHQMRPRFVLTHGYGSRGYEWVYAVTRLADYGEIYFYRWDWDQCPKRGAEGLLKAIDDLVKRDAHRPIEVWGHSYGGVITSIAAARYQGRAPLTAHVIASPVAGHPKLEGRCSTSISALTQSLQRPKGARSTKTSSTNTPTITLNAHPALPKIRQWRTRHHLDGAFKRLKADPQIVDWRGEVTRLPENYRGRRLGHNWSISWVVDHRYPP